MISAFWFRLPGAPGVPQSTEEDMQFALCELLVSFFVVGFKGEPKGSPPLKKKMGVPEENTHTKFRIMGPDERHFP